jgi:ankyrin repeat protein
MLSFIKHTYCILLIFFFVQSRQVCAFYNSPGDSVKIDTSNYIKGDKNTNLQIATYNGYVSEVDRLIKLGADVNYKSWEGVTALMYAAQNGQNELVSLLISAGANPNIQPDNGVNALLGAILNNHLETAELLVRSGANINQKDNRSVTPLMHAVAMGNYEMVDMLLYYDADLLQADLDGNDALMTAVYVNNYDLVYLLIKKGADVNTQDYKSYTPAMIALQNKNADIFELLAESGADLTLTNKYGESVIHSSILENSPELLSKVLDENIEFDKTSSGVLNPANYALKYSKNDSIKTILKQEGYTLSYAPQFGALKLTTNFIINSYGTFWGFGMGIYDKLYKISMDFNYAFCTRWQPVMTQAGDYLYYQYWEKRQIMSLMLSKEICLLGRKSAKNNAGIIPSIGGLYTFGSYEGTEKKASWNLTVAPGIKAYWKPGSFMISAGYQYTDLGLMNYSDHFFTLSLDAFINFSPRLGQKKTINWL